jgi:hypothetical protein
MLIETDVRSTDILSIAAKYGKPCRKNVSCCVDVTVVDDTTFGASPLSDTQRQRFNNVTAMPTALRTGEPAVNLYQGSTIPPALIVKLSYQLTPRGIRNTLRQLVVFHHVLYCQILNRDGLVLTHQLSCQFMEKVFAAISDPALNPGYFKPSFAAVTRAFLFAAKSLGNLSKLFLQAVKVLWVSYLSTVTGCQQASNSHVQPYRLVKSRQGFDSRIVHQQRHVPASPCIQFDSNSRWDTPLWQWTTPPNRQSFNTLCQPHAAILPLESGTGKLSTAAISLLLEVGILSTFSPKVAERFLQVSQSLLQRYAAHLPIETATLQAFSTG